MVSNYFQDCKYLVNKLQPYVYLISEDALKDIKIDNGDAYISSISETPTRLDVYGLTLTEGDELDERYKFTHTLTFSVNGYANKDDFDGKYYIIVKDDDGTYWLINPLFPSKITYTYTLAFEENHTDFNVGTVSNHPVLRLLGMTDSQPYECKKYYLSGIDGLWLNEKRYTVHDGNAVKYTNGGFKTIEYNKKSAVFTEEFDGTKVSHSIDFNVLFSDYKSSWHYNLLEFKDNLYAAVIKTTDKKYALCGFGYGLQPSFTVNANDSETINYVEIKLQDSHDVGDVIYFYDNITYEYLSGKTWEYTSEYNGYQCVGAGTATYLLKKEVDALGNETGRFMVREGHRSEFPELDLVEEEFDDDVEFENMDCGSQDCIIETGLPSLINFHSAECKQYYLKSDSNWSITSNNSSITVSPSSGVADASYVISVCNNIVPSSAAVTSNLTLNYCDTTSIINVVVSEDEDVCLPQGATYNISANEQTLTIPTKCCVTSVKDVMNVGLNITVYESYISVIVPENNTGINRTITLLVVYCDGTSGNIIINQSSVFEKWEDDSRLCVGYSEYKRQYKYTGTTSSSISSRTDEYRDVLVKTNSTYCGYVEPIYRMVDTDGFVCSGTTKYHKAKQQVSMDNGSTWNDVVPSVTGTGTLLEYLSVDCGYIPRNPPEGLLYKYWGYNLNNNETVLTYDSVNDTTSQNYWYGSGNNKVYIGNAEDDYFGFIGDFVYMVQHEMLGSNSMAQLSYKTLTIPNNVLEIGLSCLGSNFSTMQLPNKLMSFGAGLYNNSFTSGFTLPETLITLGIGAFNCPNFKSIVIPKNVTVINNRVYRAGSSSNIFNSNLESVTIKSLIPPYIDYWSGSTISSGLTIYVPSSAVNRYKESWSNWASHISGGVTTDDSFSDNYQFRVGYSGGTTQSFPIATNCIRGDYTDYGFEQPISAITSVTVSDTVKYVDMDVFNLGHDYFGENIKTLVLGSNVKRLCNTSGFEGGGFTNVTLNNGLLYISGSLFTRFQTISSDGNDEIIKSSLTSITLPSSLLFIGVNVFRGCSGLTSITIPSNVMHIGDFAFNKAGLTSITIPSSVISIGTYSFGYCNNLSSVTLNDGLKLIDYKAFTYCTSLSSITIPSSVEFIGGYAFSGCSNLERVIMQASTPPLLDTNTFDGLSSECIICVPDGSVNTYKSNSRFSRYSSIICSMSECNTPTPPTPTDIKFTAYDSGGTVYTGACESSGDTFYYDDLEVSYETLILGDCVTKVNSQAFSYSVTAITFGNGIASLPAQMLSTVANPYNYHYPNLQTITFLSSTPPTLGRSRKDSWSAWVYPFTGFNGTIYVPSNAVDTYKTATYWSNFASLIQPIP